MFKRIYLATDHGGFDLKEEIKKHLEERGKEIIDVGNKIKDEKDDYPDFVIPLAKQVAQEPESVGIILGRSGNGEIIAANKIAGIRATLCLSEKMARIAREQNNSNVLSLGADYLEVKEALKIVDTFLTTPFSEEERHSRRLKKIRDYEAAHTR
jgi:ribose 5-phosphate isomerase B